MDMESLLLQVLLRNLRVIGNCIGLSRDLEEALTDYAKGDLQVVIDAEITGQSIGSFFHRTYCSPERFGKVVFTFA